MNALISSLNNASILIFNHNHFSGDKVNLNVYIREIKIKNSIFKSSGKNKNKGIMELLSKT